MSSSGADFDGDGKADICLFRPEQGTWYIRLSAGGPDVVMQFGSASDTPVPGDYDGDGRPDYAVFRPSNGTWYVRLSAGGPDRVIPFGTGADVPVPGDYDGDGGTDYAVFRPSSGTWYVRPSTGGADFVMQFGAATDRPISWDHDTEGTTDYTVFRPTNSTWYTRPRTGGQDRVVQFGAATDLPVAGDYDGDGIPDYAVFRPSNGTWYVRPSSGGPDRIMQFGVATDVPVPDDYDGDGKTDYTVFRPSIGTWYVRPTSGGPDRVMPFGTRTDLPLRIATRNKRASREGVTPPREWDRPLLSITADLPAVPSGDWPAATCDHGTFPGVVGSTFPWIFTGPSREWRQPHDLASPDRERYLVGALGKALVYENKSLATQDATLFPRVGVSPSDFPFSHPFGIDWEFYLRLRPDFYSLLSPGNGGLPGDPGEYHEATADSRRVAGLTVPGVLGVEVDQGLVPPPFRVTTGDTVAVFGRLIVDCGHDDYHTEIHPPLFLTRAHADGPDHTAATIIGRPFLVGQAFYDDDDNDDGQFRDHLIRELAKAAGWDCPVFGLPCSLLLEANPIVDDRLPLTGSIAYTLRPPTPRRSPGDRLVVKAMLTARRGVGIGLHSDPAHDGVIISVAFNPGSMRPPPPPQITWKVLSLSELNALDASVSKYIAEVIAVEAVFAPVALIATLKGVGTYYASLPDPDFSRSRQIQKSEAELPWQLPDEMLNDAQPFPVLGMIDVGWVRDSARDPATPRNDR